MKFPEYDHLDGLGLAALIKSGEVTALEALEAAIERIESRNPKLNAVIYRAYDGARDAIAQGVPEGSFHGVPFLLKDMSARWGGHPMTCGSKLLRNYHPHSDSHLVQRFKQAGLVILGTTNAPEFGIKGVTEPTLYGPTRNPWDLAHSPGGSSGGAASAVAARMVPMAHAGDGGGSIRIPSSHCGLVGLKPSRGRTSLAPTAGHGWSGMVCPGVVARSVRDSAAILDAISGYVPGDPYTAPPPKTSFLKAAQSRKKKLRIAYWPKPLFGTVTHPDCERTLNDSITLLRDLGHEVEAAVPSFDRDSLIPAYFTIVASHIAADVRWAEQEVGRRAEPDELEPATWFLKTLGETQTALDLVQAEKTIHQAGRDVARLFAYYDVFVTSTAAQPPVQVGQLDLKWWEELGIKALQKIPSKQVMDRALQETAKSALDATPNTQLFNQTGQPAISLPLGSTRGGLPLGVQFVGRFGEEATLLRLAAEIERARPWHDAKPDWLC
ncbi:MAG: amidase [Myxococcota bacterium]|nr:amidase [Myxococcota bacterium]